MKKIAFICPYFGTFPSNQMSIWLRTCEMNPNVDWIIITDDKSQYSYPKNVKVIYTTLFDLKKNIQKKFQFEISLNSAYKLCDFKPTYGYIFQDLIEGYDYWGHCDLSDSIFGDIEKCLNDILEKDYDKIGFLGHLTLYKNTKEVNERFFLASNTKLPLQKILGVPNNMAFDETYDYSINYIYIDNGYSIKRIDDLYFDVSTRSSSFKKSLWSEKLEWLGVSKEKYIFEWDKGKLYEVSFKNGTMYKKEILYVHYQKRKMICQIDINNINHFLLIPNKFINYTIIDNKTFRKYTRNKIINTTLLKIRINKLKKILKGK